MVKASLRTKSVGTKVSDAEYAQLEGSRPGNYLLSGIGGGMIDWNHGSSQLSHKTSSEPQ
jgi:hypothetical protein